MTLQIGLVLAVLAAAVVLFVSERLRVDLVALLVLIALVVLGLVTPSEALSGFSSPAVVTVWAVFILSGGLAQTGVANYIGQQVLRLAGSGEARLIMVIMVTAGVLSAFMNNVGVAALLLPVVMEIARRTNRSPSRLLMPLAYGALLGGLMTLIGTPPNILASDALGEFGLEPFGMFDYTPVGVVVLVVGVLFMMTIGRHLLPQRDVKGETLRGETEDLKELYNLQARMFVVRVPPGTGLVGARLAESYLGSALGMNVVSLSRNGETMLAPAPETVLQANDRLVVMGQTGQVKLMPLDEILRVTQIPLSLESITGTDVVLAALQIRGDSPFIGRNLEDLGIRNRFGVNVLGIWRQGKPQANSYQLLSLKIGDELLLQGTESKIDALGEQAGVQTSAVSLTQLQQLEEQLLLLQLPETSRMAGNTLAESRLGDAFGLSVLGITRNGKTRLMPGADDVLEAGDTLLVNGAREDLDVIRGLTMLQLETTVSTLPELESERIGLVEAVLSPHTTLAGKTLQEINFREKFDLNVIAIWRRGRAYRSNLRSMPLRFGDALLLHGPRHKFRLLAADADFLLLQEDAQVPVRANKAILAAFIMGVVLLPVLMGWLPIAIAAIIGAVLMVLSGCLTMDEAYRVIEWKAVFLIAGMLPLGIAMESSGAAQFLAETMVGLVGELGNTAVLAGLFILTSLASQVMPNPVVTVLMAPIAINTAQDMGLSPYALMMIVALSASASFLSPVGHPANVLIMGPGGYRFSDYIRVGLPLTLLVLLVALTVLPFFWPV